MKKLLGAVPNSEVSESEKWVGEERGEGTRDSSSGGDPGDDGEGGGGEGDSPPEPGFARNFKGR